MEEEQQLTISKRLLGLGASAAIVMAACGPGTPNPPPLTPAPPPGPPARRGGPPPAGGGKYIACVAFDTGGLGDKGFNDLAKKGLDDAKAPGFTTFFSEAKGATDYTAQHSDA